MATITGSEVLAQSLRSQGVDTMFYLMGGPMLETEAACIKLGIRAIDTRHEQAAALAAHAWTRVTRRPGVAMACSGPGAINLATGVANAWTDCAPLVAIGGSSPRVFLGMEAFQEVDQVAVFRPVTKWATRVTDPARISDTIQEGFQRARSGRPGPVFIDLPADVLYGSLPDEDEARASERRTFSMLRNVALAPNTLALPRSAADPAQVDQAIRSLRDAERPIIVSGSGVMWSEASEALTAFVDQTGIPFFTTPQGYSGRSINAYDAVKKRWQQTWMDNQGGVHNYVGQARDGNLYYEAEGVYVPGQAGLVKAKMTFFNQGRDKVRQLGEQSVDDGKTWTTAYDLIYTRRGSSISMEIVELNQITLRVNSVANVKITADLVRKTLGVRDESASKKLKDAKAEEALAITPAGSTIESPARGDVAVIVPEELLEQARVTRLMFMVLMGMIAAISLLVGGIGIMNIMLATVTERTREIGIRRALGATRSHIILQFLVETVSLSVVGGITGIVAGLLCPAVVVGTRYLLNEFAEDLMSKLPDVVQKIEPQIVLASLPLAFFISVIVGVVFGIYPAFRAAKMDPIEALRHE